MVKKGHRHQCWSHPMFHLNLIIFQIKGEYQFNYPELALLLVEDQEWGKVTYPWRGASYAIFITGMLSQFIHKESALMLMFALTLTLWRECTDFNCNIRTKRLDWLKSVNVDAFQMTAPYLELFWHETEYFQFMVKYSSGWTKLHLLPENM